MGVNFLIAIRVWFVPTLLTGFSAKRHSFQCTEWPDSLRSTFLNATKYVAGGALFFTKSNGRV